ncbi:hypothetical protein AJ78_03617 [Emergomyces pasteurianus Ep9510]|uniref:Uncharacterized protein n=1 Tax=Emergomyces pasteurianus Ep9510 TaxID=1447872 RepID=A0A1J9PIA9_9EURO|nr:hypothetical protein AJ78_03617 [Emergomyces pasteurianus Ep9510]
MDSTHPSGYYHPLVQPVPTEGFFNNIMAQQFSFVDEATYHMESFREDCTSSGWVNPKHETVDPRLIESQDPEPVNALGGEETISEFAPCPPATETLSITPPSKTSNPKSSRAEMAATDYVGTSATRKHSTEHSESILPALPHSASGSTLNPQSKNANSAGCDGEKNEYDSTDAVNLDFFQPKAAAENTKREARHDTYFRSCTTNTEIGMTGGYRRHQPYYTSPVRSASFPINAVNPDSDLSVPTTHQPEDMKVESRTPTSPTPPTSPARQIDPDNELQFSCAEEANAWRAFEVHVDYDPTIPKTLEVKRKIVTEMLKAMKSIDYAEDNEGMIRPFREHKHSPIRMEIVCWNILDSCISRHENGPLLAIYDGKAKNSGQLSTFRERMEKIIECLWTQKTICKHLLDAYYLFTFVDDPICAKNRVVANKNLNKRKGEVMNAGKKALGHSRTNSKSAPAKHTSEVHEGPCTPFSTPRRETPTRNTNTPMTINTNVRNMTLDSSPHIHSQPTQQMGFSSPAEPPNQENTSHPIHHGIIPMASHPQLINTSDTGQNFGPNLMITSGYTGQSQPAPGFMRSQSASAIHGLGQSPLYKNNGPYNREEMTEQFRQYSPAQLQPIMYHSPSAPNSNRRAMGPAPHPWMSYQHTTTPAPSSHQPHNAPFSEASYGHGRKRSQDESDASDYFPSPQKKVR